MLMLKTILESSYLINKQMRKLGQISLTRLDSWFVEEQEPEAKSLVSPSRVLQTLPHIQ